ncbi:MAG: hypothetical protein IKG22_11660 [Atopobiaceae bacterium]|nr:hypothetical protein [Atopobiaceae bacterium]
MRRIATTRRGFMAMSTSLAALLAGCGAKQGATAASNETGATARSTNSTASVARETISNDVDGEHAIEVSGEQKAYAAVDVTKTGNAEGDEADFYGENAAVFATEKATLDLEDVSVTTDGTHANAIFSYGEGTTVNVSNSTIETSGNCSGGIMVTGGGTLNATNLQVHTTGNSSASIRSDRGGGVQNVTGGTYATDGTGSPAIYSTAEVHVSKATLSSTASQGVVVEGKNSVELAECALTADNNTKNSDKSDWYQAVMIYQSMSGDAAEGTASFSMSGGSLVNVNGDVFFVNNTVATISLSGVAVSNQDGEGNLLRAAAAGWGSEGNNGGQVTLKANGQELAGTILVDEVSNLNLYLAEGSSFAGAINPEGAAGDVYVEVADGSMWELTADAYVTGLTCGTDAIALNGYTLHVGDATYEEGSESKGEPIQTKVSEASGGPGDGGEPPQKPDGGSGEPPAKPDGQGGEPPAKPDGQGGEPPAKPGETPDSSTNAA